MKYLILSCLLVVGCSNNYSCDIDAVFSDVTPMVQEANEAFNKAELEIFNVVPENIIRPDPDPKKCPCGGSGLIKQGDGHTTACPYHSKTTHVITR